MIKRLATDHRTPRLQRWLLLGLALYLVSPIDVIPDFVPGIGQLDDALLVIIALRALLHRHGADRIGEAWPGPESSLRVVLHAAGAPADGTTLVADR
jgi:uncharacterized membrane protein YkvA (DUF1232 family)